MNQGIFGFPTPVAGSIISITEFDASGTYTIPDEATSLEILLVGGGGGGGSGARAAGTNTTSGGGGGGSGGGFVHQVFYKNDYRYIKNLNITIGAGGAGGVARTAAITVANSGQGGAVASPGGFSRVQNSVVITEPINDFILTAPGGGGGGAGAPPTPAGAAVGGEARNFFIGGTPDTLQLGAVGSVSTDNSTSITTPGPNVAYTNIRFNQGAGGGSATSTTTALSGGSIQISPPTTIPSVISMNYAGLTYGGITAGYGGPINSGNIGGKGADGIELYKLGSGSQYFSGFGGGGGGGANSVGGGNGGNGYRGGGGGGGGGIRSPNATLAAGEVPAGAGGRGGNGYCRIIARK